MTANHISSLFYPQPNRSYVPYPDHEFFAVDAHDRSTCAMVPGIMRRAIYTSQYSQRVRVLSKRELKKILYTEDDLDIQEVTRMALEVVGDYEIALCSSGREALEKVSQFHPVLILLDVMMPGMDGLGTLEALRTLPDSADTPVVFVTANVQTNEIAQYRQLGAIEVIAKPFNPMTLAQDILQLWDRHVAGAESPAP
tara:strand:- start:406 stop:996 length:591 start_codon:yes stop_codon:yes gene_type:complete